MGRCPGVFSEYAVMDLREVMPIPVFVADILPHIAAGHFKPVVDKVFPFAQMGEAKAYMESNQQVGKIVLSTLIA